MGTTLVEDYAVAAGRVTLSVLVGDGQMGTSVVRLDQEQLAIGDITDLAIGRGPDIAGKQLFVKTVVTDVNDKTNHTSVRYELKGGKADKNFDLAESVDQEGGSIIYRATFALKLLLLFCFLASGLSAQSDTLRSFRTPASPAFILLGVAPTAVERPATPQSLVASLSAALRDKHFPPKRYAL